MPRTSGKCGENTGAESKKNSGRRSKRLTVPARWVGMTLVISDKAIQEGQRLDFEREIHRLPEKTLYFD